MRIACLNRVSAIFVEGVMRKIVGSSGKLGPILCASALCAFLVSGGAVAQGLSPNQQLAHDIYKELLEIDTTTATGDTKAAANAMAARLKAGGFPDADVQVFSPAPRKGQPGGAPAWYRQAQANPFACTSRCRPGAT
jgi:hypothetical protein